MIARFSIIQVLTLHVSSLSNPLNGICFSKVKKDDGKKVSEVLLLTLNYVAHIHLTSLLRKKFWSVSFLNKCCRICICHVMYNYSCIFIWITYTTWSCCLIHLVLCGLCTNYLMHLFSFEFWPYKTLWYMLWVCPSGTIYQVLNIFWMDSLTLCLEILWFSWWVP